MREKYRYIYSIIGIFIILFLLHSSVLGAEDFVPFPIIQTLSPKIGGKDSVCLSYTQGGMAQNKNYVYIYINQPIRLSVKVRNTTMIRHNNELMPMMLTLNIHAPERDLETIWPSAVNEKTWQKYIYTSGTYKITYDNIGKTNYMAALPENDMAIGANIYKINIEIAYEAIPKETAISPFPDIPDLPPYSFWNITNGAHHNHVATFEPTISEDEGMTSVSYYDEFGKELESVQVGLVQSDKNVVTYQEYDPWGRKGKSWSPISVDAQNGDLFTPLESIKNMTDNTEPFGYSTYQPSTIGLETERFGDGKEWHEAGKSIKMDYLTNKEGDDSLNCMHLEACVLNEDIDIKYIDNYPTGSLLVTQAIDEDGKTSFAFKDTFGRTLLTRRKLTTGNEEKFLDTYYIYDKIDQLVAVVPPAMTMLVANNFMAEDWIYAYIYAYKYDEQGRNIAKKLPGRDWTYMAYDKNDRIVYSQDGEQRLKGSVAFHLYDIFGRECISGTCKGENIPDISQIDVTCKYTGKNKELWGYECKAMTLNDVKVQSVNYYDNYKFLKDGMMPYMFQGAYKKTEDYATLYNTPQGLCTGNIRKILGHEQDGDGVFSAYYYDALGRVAQKRIFNDLTDNEAIYYKYNITNAPAKVRHDYGNSNTDTEVYEYTYDRAKRLIKETLSFNGATPVVLCENEYDELGRLARSKHAQNELATTEFEYNNRSWLTSINSPLFEENLFYNTGSRPLYSGKISMMEWKTTKNSMKRNYYKFTYDGLGRISRAIYGGGRAFAEMLDYDDMGNVTKLQRCGLSDGGNTCAIDNLALKYIGNQLRKVTDSSDGPFYKGTFHFIDGADEDFEYGYDANGNMTRDLNKGITSITYNDRNLPQIITFKLKDDLTQTETEESIEYYYDSDGEKRGVSYSTNDDFIAYTENRVFENGDLRYLLFEGGYASFERGEKNPTFHFYIKDHIGNNRVVADARGNVEQENHYYPSGTLIMGSKFTQDITSNQRYRFGGKELDRMYGLDWYDFGARMYDPLLYRWMTMDPLCEKYYDISPYVYCNNDPINIFDPNGMDQYEINGLGTVVNIIKDDEKDAFYRVNKTEDGTYYRTGAYLVLPYSSVSQYNEAKDIENVSYSVFIINNVSAGKSLFEFFADNTSVEWTQYSLSDSKGNNFSTVSSSHQALCDSSGGALQNWILENGLSVKEHAHNHPNENPVEMPSGLLPDDKYGDIDFARNLNYKLQMANKDPPIYKLYVNKKYIYWNENSKPTDFGRAADGTWLPTLPEVICKP